MTCDFVDMAWKANFVSGPLRGTTYSSTVSGMSAEPWAVVQTALAVDFEKATKPEMKEGARLLLQKHCEGLLAQHGQ